MRVLCVKVNVCMCTCICVSMGVRMYVCKYAYERACGVRFAPCLVRYLLLYKHLSFRMSAINVSRCVHDNADRHTGYSDKATNIHVIS